jgi:hypothetical protein
MTNNVLPNSSQILTQNNVIFFQTMFGDDLHIA